MKFQVACLLCLLAGAALADADHPIAKVISLLGQLKEQAEAEHKSEELAYDKYVYQCGVNTATLNKAITDEEAAIDELSDTIDSKTKEIATLTEELAALEAEDLANNASLAKLTAARNESNTLFTGTEKELKATLKAIQSAIAALEGAEAKTEADLMQTKKRVEKALALIQQSSRDLPTGDLKAHVDKYDFKSEKVIELFKDLEAKFETKLVDLNAEETNSLNAYTLAKENLQNMADAVAKSTKAKGEAKAAAEGDLAAAKTDLASTEADKKADTATLEKTTAACALKKDEWEARSATRAGEIAAMEEAVEILSKASGVRSEAPENPVPPPSPVALLQLTSVPAGGDRRAQAVSKVMNLLLRTAKVRHSNMFLRLAAEVKAQLTAPYDDYVFQPVINMIEKMIFQLQEEQTAEDEHKAWCDKELAKTNAMIDDKKEKKNETSVKKEFEMAKIRELSAAIQKSEDMIASIVEFKAEATETRKVGAKENKLALEDSEKAQAALASAIAVLTDFYKSSGMIEKAKWEFVQEPVVLPADPKTWSASYTGVTDPSKPKGIITVLQTVLDGFVKMEADTKSQEAADQKAYDDEMSAADIEQARREEDVKQKSAEKSQRVSDVADLTAELKHIGSELDQTVQYMKDLQKACVEADSTYDDRKAARAEEIQALKDAEQTLLTAFAPPGKLLLVQPKETEKKFLNVAPHSQLA